MPQDRLPLVVSQPHAHLRLAGRVRRGARVRSSRPVLSDVRHPDQRAHGAALAGQIAKLRALHAKRVPVLGVDPALVVVAAFNSPPGHEDLRRADLHVLEWLDGEVVLAAPAAGGLDELARRVEEYRRGPRPDAPAADVVDDEDEDDADGGGGGEAEDQDHPNGAGGTDGSEEGPDRQPTARYQGLLDKIDEVRPFGPRDVPTSALLAAAAAADPAQALRVDMQCWCAEDPADARRAHDGAARAVELASGWILDRTLRHAAGLSLIRADVPSGAVRDLARTGLFRRIDVLPRPDLDTASTLLASHGQLPPVMPPHDGAPAVAVVDSGVRSAHPLLAPAVVAVLSEGVPEVHDDNGHGTFVASLALHGSLEPLLAAGVPVRPAGRLISVRVLDSQGRFPETSLWEATLLAALETAADAGASVVNLSLGDERAPYRSERPTPLGAAIDDFIRRRGVVVVVSAGNFRPEQYAPGPDLPTGYAHTLLADPAAGILDPAPSGLSLTVGALGGDDGQGTRRPREDVDRLPLGGESLPSPATRRGPGPRRMVKPELAAPGGSYDHDTVTGRAAAAAHRGVVGAAAAPAERLLTTRTGTSAAAPLVTHAVLRAHAENPGLSANAAKVLVLASAAPHENWFAGGMTKGQERTATLALGGYGRPDAERAARSTDHRVVLLAENALPLDGVHLYRVEIPSSFFEPGGWRRLTVALVYDPPVRSTRLQYFASEMHVNIYRGLTVNRVAAAYIEDEDEDDETVAGGLPEKPADAAPDREDDRDRGRGGARDEDGQDDDGGAEDYDSEDGDGGEPAARVGPSTIRPWLLGGMQPSEQARSRGANQFATRRFMRPLRSEDGLDLIVAVQGRQNWPTGDAAQPYALALVFERDDDHAEVYADLRAFVELDAALEAEVGGVVEVELGR